MCRSRSRWGWRWIQNVDETIIMSISVPLLGTGVLCMYVGLVRSTINSEQLVGVQPFSKHLFFLVINTKHFFWVQPSSKYETTSLSNNKIQCSQLFVTLLLTVSSWSEYDHPPNILWFVYQFWAVAWGKIILQTSDNSLSNNMSQCSQYSLSLKPFIQLSNLLSFTNPTMTHHHPPSCLKMVVCYSLAWSLLPSDRSAWSWNLSDLHCIIGLGRLAFLVVGWIPDGYLRAVKLWVEPFNHHPSSLM